jgi:phospho-N-acetylmuramoyl-pentapeptide-transferase
VRYNHVFNVFRYVTFRSIAAFLTAFIFAIFLGPRFIKLLKKNKAVEKASVVRPKSHDKKEGTPTMGGLIILAGLMLSSLLWNNLTNCYILLLYITVGTLGALGFLDDYLKNFKHEEDGLRARYKLYGQIGLGLLIGLYLFFDTGSVNITKVSVPFLKNFFINFGIFFVPFVIFMITATSNAVNLTDGLDGLAAGTVALTSFGLAVFSYMKGNFKLAAYFNLDFIPQSGELTIFMFALIGTILGFLWYNSNPAEIFMGDTGSLALGGILAVVSILLREEIVFAIMGLFFVMEALSSLIQRYYFRYTRIKFGKGKRFFLKAPIHHHFEEKNISEQKIVVRVWILTALSVAIGLITLKVR